MSPVTEGKEQSTWPVGQDSSTELNVLLIDDSSADTLLITEALKAIKDIRTVYTSASGQLGLERLGVSPSDQLSIMPDLVLLDLYMPGLNGFQVLERIRAAPRFASMPIVVFSSSKAQEDVLRAYQLGASAFIHKPEDPAGFTNVVQGVMEIWLKRGAHKGLF